MQGDRLGHEQGRWQSAGRWQQFRPQALLSEFPTLHAGLTAISTANPQPLLLNGEWDFALDSKPAALPVGRAAVWRESGDVVVGEHKLRISHCICALPGQELKDIREVYSHPIALRQCEDFLEKNHHIRAVEADDTALSAKEIADTGVTGRAAICSAYAARMYGLEILADEIETNKRNFTRFLIVAHPDTAERLRPSITSNKASVVFTLPHEEGSLAKVLSILSFYHINATKIQSLPIIGREWEYQFYINLTFDSYERYRQSLDAIRPLLKDFQILGEYGEAATPL